LPPKQNLSADPVCLYPREDTGYGSASVYEEQVDTYELIGCGRKKQQFSTG